MRKAVDHNEVEGDDGAHLNPGEALGSGFGKTPRGGSAAGDSAPAFGVGLIGEAVALLDSVVEYVFSRMRLEEYKLELRAREFLIRSMALIGAVLVSLMGLVFLSLGVATAISERTQSRPAGLAIVGGFYLLLGIFVVLMARGRSRRT